MLESRAAQGQRSVLHVATHFNLAPGNFLESTLLLGDETTYSVRELHNALDADLNDIDLVTLSACNSVIGERADGKEFEGLGATFQNKGARAVLGSLWAVADTSTAELMREFYKARGETRANSKAKALQMAQQAMIGKGNVWAHPYYWSGFVLMGNWL